MQRAQAACVPTVQRVVPRPQIPDYSCFVSCGLVAVYVVYVFFGVFCFDACTGACLPDAGTDSCFMMRAVIQVRFEPVPAFLLIFFITPTGPA